MPKLQINGALPPFPPHAFRNLTSLDGVPTKEKFALIHTVF
jgi:hypothetical protein